jgi:hypothetical protein
MEKLAYLLMGSSRPPGAGVFLESVPELFRLGARSVQLNLADPSLGHPFGVEPEPATDQILAGAFIWVDSSEGTRVASALPSVGGATWHGWLVCESEPLTNATHPPGQDGKVPGFAQLVGLNRPGNLSWSEWRRIWQAEHTPVALHTQAAFRVVQNVVFRALTAGAPPFAAIVEECFPVEAAKDLHVFFDAAGDDARLGRHMAAMSESCDRFMDGQAPVVWTSEWVFSSP